MAAVVGVGWIAQADFETLVGMCDDRDALQMTWAEWLARAELGAAWLEAQGFVVTRVLIVPEIFAAWCRENGRRMDASARSKYAELEAKRLAPRG